MTVALQEDNSKKALSSAVWKFLERISAQLVTTIVGIVLARILSPSHYGIIAIVNIFITICNVFVVTGLGESLVQKKNSDDLDFSSMFYVNVGLSVLLYAILFFSAPLISAFYNNQYTELTLIIRVMGLRLIFAAAGSIQSAIVAKKMAFKKYFWVTMIGTVVSGVVGITMAVKGYGVWALVGQYMTSTILNTILLFFFLRWLPKLKFSWARVKPLTSYGVKILGSALITTLYNESRDLVIGKKYSAEDLAYYSKGGTYPKLIINNLNSALGTVLFPILAQNQDNLDRLIGIFKKTLRLVSFIVFPAMLGLAIVADDFVSILLTDKWLPCVPYFRAMCLVYAIIPLSTINCQCLTVRGYSGRALGINIVKKIIGIALLLASFSFGVGWIMATFVLSILIEYVIDCFITKKHLKVGIFSQINELIPQLLLTVVMGGVIVLFKIFVCPHMHIILGFILQIIIGVLVYLLMALLTKNKSFAYLWNTIKRKFRKTACGEKTIAQ